MNTRQLITWVWLMVIFSMILSCADHVVYHRTQQVETEAWHIEDTLQFDVHIDDTLSLHELYIDVRNTTAYPYRNLFLFMDIEFPGGHVLRDTLECILAERDGSWTGKGFGRIKSNRFMFRDDVWFPDTGVYTFKVCQGMRYEKISGITDIGIRIDSK